jgi:hypothetical protein
MNREIQKYLEYNNASIRFNRGEIEVTYTYGDLGKVETYKNFDDLFEGIKWESYESTLKLQVEISGRRTGKTSRLIDAMGDHIKNGGICFLYCVSKDMGKLIVDKLIDLFGSDYIRSSIFINPSNITIAEIKSEDLIRMRPFYDEFDILKPEHQSFNPLGYYCTTPAFLRDSEIVENYFLGRWVDEKEAALGDDLLLKLIFRSNFNYEHRQNNNLGEYINYISKEQFEIESGRIFL